MIELTLILLNLILLYAQLVNKIDYYMNLINQANRNALTYEWPINAYEHFAYGKREKYGTFDFVVVGAGSAGTVIARRLSEVKYWKVLLLEAGTEGDDISTIPNSVFPIQFTRFNWGYNSTLQKQGCQGNIDQTCTYATGKGIGGTTLINGVFYARGHKNDFEKWAQIVESKRWSYNNVLKYFKKSENFVPTDPNAPYDFKYHGSDGPLRVEFHLPRSPQLNAFLEANKELGYDIVDYNANGIGGSITQLNIKNGRRVDGGKAFLDPVRERSNLEILPESYVTKIQIDKKRKIAVGVNFSHKGKNYFVEARKEVILSAGAIGSPQILMWSGIGPRKHLEKLRIEVVANLEVGSTLRDHIFYWGFNVVTNYTEPGRSLRSSVTEFLHDKGPLTIALNGQGLGMYESSLTKGSGDPDIELIFQPVNSLDKLFKRTFSISDETFQDVTKDINPSQTISFLIVNVHTKSTGTLRLSSNNPYDYPLIDPNVLSDPQHIDIKTMYNGIHLAMKFLETKAFKTMNAKLLRRPLRACKDHEYLSKGYWYCAIKQLSMPFNHPVATCSMGKYPKKGAVVDSELRVFGLKNLRVADASVIPISLACHTSAPTVMVGEQLGDIVKETYNIISGLNMTLL